MTRMRMSGRCASAVPDEVDRIPSRRPRESGDPGATARRSPWVPACAGTTVKWFHLLGPCSSGTSKQNGSREHSCRKKVARSAWGLVSRVTPVHTAMRNCTRDEGRSFEFGNQVLISSHRKLLWSKATVVNVAEKSGRDPVRHG